jgi:hypothetical protein
MVTMQYLMMIFGDESAEAAASAEEETAMLGEYGVWAEAAGKAGVLRGGERLRPTSAATVVRVRDGETLTTDGPYADTKEQLGGYFIVDCANLDEALEWAGRIPGARFGAIEVRPIWELA